MWLSPGEVNHFVLRVESATGDNEERENKNIIAGMCHLSFRLEFKSAVEFHIRNDSYLITLFRVLQQLLSRRVSSQVHK